MRCKKISGSVSELWVIGAKWQQSVHWTGGQVDEIKSGFPICQVDIECLTELSSTYLRVKD